MTDAREIFEQWIRSKNPDNVPPEFFELAFSKMYENDNGIWGAFKHGYDSIRSDLAEKDADVDQYRTLYEICSREATERKNQIDQQITQIDQLIFIIGQIRILVNGVQPDSEIVKSVSELINNM